ncbi:MAG: hypothetical protein RLZZ440_2058 [Planctomycetota bacterium]
MVSGFRPVETGRKPGRQAAEETERATLWSCGPEKGQAMLAITANWGLTDGSLGGSGPGAVQGWIDRIHAAVIRGSIDPGGRYQPADQVVLVLAGDTFDLLSSAAWASQVRPWHRGRRSHALRLAVLHEAIRRLRRPLGRLARWAGRGLAVPAADARGRPVDTLRRRAEMRVVILAGDRDQFLPDLAHAAANWGIQIGLGWSDGRHEVCHGHAFDPAGFSSAAACLPDAAQPTLAESIAVDLLVPFGVSLRGMPAVWRRLGPGFPRLLATGLSRLPSGIAATLAGLPEPLAAAVASAWARSIDRWLTAAHREPPAFDGGFDATADLAGWLAGAASVGRPPAPLPWLSITPPPPVAGRIQICGHLAPSEASAGVIGLDGAEPKLLLRPRPAAAVTLTQLGLEPQREAIVCVGRGGSGRGIVDAA